VEKRKQRVCSQPSLCNEIVLLVMQVQSSLLLLQLLLLEL
jgi:hypothetical protein